MLCQDSEAIAKDEVQKVLKLTEDRRTQWERAWDDRRATLEQNLQVCQFYYDLKQVRALLPWREGSVGRHGLQSGSCRKTCMRHEYFC